MHDVPQIANQRKMASIKEVNLSIGQISFIGFRTSGKEARDRLVTDDNTAYYFFIRGSILQLVIFSPYSEQRHLRLAQVLLILWVLCNVCLIVEEVI